MRCFVVLWAALVITSAVNTPPATPGKYEEKKDCPSETQEPPTVVVATPQANQQTEGEPTTATNPRPEPTDRGQFGGLWPQRTAPTASASNQSLPSTSSPSFSNGSSLGSTSDLSVRKLLSQGVLSLVDCRIELSDTLRVIGKAVQRNHNVS